MQNKELVQHLSDLLVSPSKQTLWDRIQSSQEGESHQKVNEIFRTDASFEAVMRIVLEQADNPEASLEIGEILYDLYTTEFRMFFPHTFADRFLLFLGALLIDDRIQMSILYLVSELAKSDEINGHLVSIDDLHMKLYTATEENPKELERFKTAEMKKGFSKHIPTIKKATEILRPASWVTWKDTEQAYASGSLKAAYRFMLYHSAFATLINHMWTIEKDRDHCQFTSEVLLECLETEANNLSSLIDADLRLGLFIEALILNERLEKSVLPFAEDLASSERFGAFVRDNKAIQDKVSRLKEPSPAN